MVLTQYFFYFFVTLYSFWRPNCKYITRDGFVLSYRLLNLTKNLAELLTNSFVWTWSQNVLLIRDSNYCFYLQYELVW